MPPNITGRYTLVSQENVDPYLQALDVNIALRKIASLLKPEKEIEQEGDHMIIRTLSTFRNYIMDFTLGVEFDEDMAVIDGRMVKTTVSWEGDKLVCVQKGEVKNRGWTQWLEGDLLHVELTAGNATAVQVFQKVK